MIAYLDSSVLLRVILGQRNALKEWRSIEQGVASALVEVECPECPAVECPACQAEECPECRGWVVVEPRPPKAAG